VEFPRRCIEDRQYISDHQNPELRRLRKIPIPAGESNWETCGEFEFAQDAQLVWLMPHMHLPGKDMTFNLISPHGHSETVLSARFNFNWQLGYELEPIRVRKGMSQL